MNTNSFSFICENVFGLLLKMTTNGTCLHWTTLSCCWYRVRSRHALCGQRDNRRLIIMNRGFVYALFEPSVTTCQTVRGNALRRTAPWHLEISQVSGNLPTERYVAPAFKNRTAHNSSSILTHWGRVTHICVFTLQLCKTDDPNLRF